MSTRKIHRAESQIVRKKCAEFRACIMFFIFQKNNAESNKTQSKLV